MLLADVVSCVGIIVAIQCAGSAHGRGQEEVGACLASKKAWSGHAESARNAAGGEEEIEMSCWSASFAHRAAARNIIRTADAVKE